MVAFHYFLRCLCRTGRGCKVGRFPPWSMIGRRQFKVLFFGSCLYGTVCSWDSCTEKCARKKIIFAIESRGVLTVLYYETQVPPPCYSLLFWPTIVTIMLLCYKQLTIVTKKSLVDNEDKLTSPTSFIRITIVVKACEENNLSYFLFLQSTSTSTLFSNI